MSQKVELLIENCHQALLTGEPEQGSSALGNASVAVADGKIVEVGEAGDISRRFRAKERLDGSGRILTPGFVDSHTHVVFGGDRSQEFVRRCQGACYEEIAAEGGGIRSTVRATRAATEDELFASAVPRLVRMASLGTTTVEIKSGYGLELDTEMRMLRVIRRLDESLPIRIVATFMGAHEFPDEYREDRDGYVDLVCDTMIPAVAASDLARFCDVFCERSVFTPEQTRRILETGVSAGLQPKVHADELAASGGSQVAAEVHAISADHLMKIDLDGVAGLHAAGVVPTLLPGTTFFLGKDEYAPARTLLAAELPVALATDRNPGSCTIESMSFIIGLSCLRMGMTPMEALRGATEHGARALGLEKQCGRIASGYAADLILWECGDFAQIVYQFENIIPRTVLSAGKPVVAANPPRRG